MLPWKHIAKSDSFMTHFLQCSDCIFAHNYFRYQYLEYSSVPSSVYIEGNTDYYMMYTLGGIMYGYHENNIITIQDSKFENNSCDRSRNCSALHLYNADNVALDNTSFTDNSCLGITLRGSFVTIRNNLVSTRNHGKASGGAIYLEHTFLLNQKNSLPPLPKFSRITLTSNAYLHASNNTALGYGGAIYTDEACNYRDKRKYCFFQFQSNLNISSRLNFVNNHAQFGGDAIFGGCLSNCFINSNETVDMRRPENVFWNIVSFNSDESQSHFAEHPYRVVFCEKGTSQTSKDACLGETRNITVHRGEMFTLHIMAVGNSCSPSSNVILVRVSEEHSTAVRIGREQGIKQTNPYCNGYLFSLLSYSEKLTMFSVEVNLNVQEELSTHASLMVEFKNYCPLGFELDRFREKCICSLLILSKGIVCNSDYSFTVPALTWIGTWYGHVAVGPYCQNCQVNEKAALDIVNNSDKLCTSRRRGFICGECLEGYSIKLGGYECDDCSTSNYKGIILTVTFAIIGFLLTFLLLRLNFTTSSGLINGLIFYSNIVYSNHEVFLPISRDKTKLDSMVHFLYIFQAWMNLDFGFDICYFHGLDVYAITWLQFVFPIYIWLIIFIIVIISRYSTKVSKFTGHNTISVLATLMLLSYTKLLLAIISASSYTQLYLSNGKKSFPLWYSDANVRYLTGKHIGLFLMSTLMILTYILPFTFFVTLGPILQANSNRKGLRWIMNMKPFLDAFYGPYTIRYRYWPGVLLLLRLFLLTSFAFYSLGDVSFKAATITVSAFLLFLLWLLLGNTNAKSLHRNRKLNILELFFLCNLSLYATISLYLQTHKANGIYNQQILAVVMVGSVFAIFCSILTYCIFCAIQKWKIIRKVVGALPCIPTKQEGREDELLSCGSIRECKHQNYQTITKTTVEVSDHFKGTGFREPLLESCDNTVNT